ncbi:MAG: DNA mismatch repair protein [Planctomycetota bacterium]|nr:DNA mismatch repair protein [Planctomycetota bacterium]
MSFDPSDSVEKRVAFYQKKADFQQAKIEEYTRPLRSLLVARGLLLLTLMISGVLTLVTLNGWAMMIAGLSFPAFVWSAYRHDNYERLRHVARLVGQNHLHAMARLQRHWDELPVLRTEIPEEQKPLAKDLDLFDKASLFQWLCVARTPMGCDALRDWLLAPAPPMEIQRRQAAVGDLREELEYLDQLQLKAQLLSGSKNGPKQFVQWAESPRWLERIRWLTPTVRGLAVASLLLIILLSFGWVDATVGGVSLCSLLVANFLLTIWYAGRIHDNFNSVAAKQADVLHYRKLFEHAANVPGTSPLIELIQSGLNAGQQPAIDSIAQLGLVMSMANLRRGGLFGLIYLFLQFLFLWDFHWLAVLENWHRRHGQHVRGWFDALGQLEAISCLARMAHDQPNWNFPTVADLAPEDAMVTAVELGHPLLSDTDRVCNTVSIGPAGTVLLVTGSNMSGKSTLLRSLGANLVLAQAGGVVCAEALTLPSLQLATSMRIHDSLADGVSFYMAELQRLKQVVDHARERRASTGPRLFFLLDEILQGTNSLERHVAVSQVVHHLIESGAIGAVSTHDLELANAEGLQGRCQPVHFRESFVHEDGKDRMEFDYQMRPGIATTTNALKLLEMVGLQAEESPPEHRVR